MAVKGILFRVLPSSTNSPLYKIRTAFVFRIANISGFINANFPK